MKLWIYAKSSHRESLDNVRRCAAITNALSEFEPTLCTGDYRAASIAKDTMDVKNSMGIDAMGNLPHTMERLDILIYDNEDVRQDMYEGMLEFCSRLYALGKDLPFDIVDKSYFAQSDFSRKKAIFFSDDDYHKWFLEFCKDSKKHNLPLLNGNYFFLDTLQEFEKSFSEVIDEEEYKDVVQNTEYLLSASVHTCLESLAAGNKPLFFRRQDQEILHEELIEKYNIPTLECDTLDTLIENYEKVILHYPQTKKIEQFDFSEIKEQIASTFDEYKHIASALDYSYAYPAK
jgi:hypothetical protein